MKKQDISGKECPVLDHSTIFFPIFRQLLPNTLQPGPYRFRIADQAGFFTAQPTGAMDFAFCQSPPLVVLDVPLAFPGDPPLPIDHTIPVVAVQCAIFVCCSRFQLSSRSLGNGFACKSLQGIDFHSYRQSVMTKLQFAMVDHPDMICIYFNGAIAGMSKMEIKQESMPEGNRRCAI